MTWVVKLAQRQLHARTTLCLISAWGQKWHTTRARQACARVDGPYWKTMRMREGRVRAMGLVLLA